MEKFTKVVEAVTQVGQPDQYGNLAYSVKFQDGTSGFFKCKEQNLFFAGQPATFYMGKQVGKSGKEYYKIERVEKHENNFEKKSTFSKKVSEKDRNRSFALAYAKDIYVAHWSSGEIPVPNPVEITEYADVFLAWLEDENGDKKDDQKKDEIVDELPF